MHSLLLYWAMLSSGYFKCFIGNVLVESFLTFWNKFKLYPMLKYCFLPGHMYQKYWCLQRDKERRWHWEQWFRKKFSSQVDKNVCLWTISVSEVFLNSHQITHWNVSSSTMKVKVFLSSFLNTSVWFFVPKVYKIIFKFPPQNWNKAFNLRSNKLFLQPGQAL